ncbi:MAG: UbiA family prenyltransferase [Pseudomonadota bacterium]
MSKRPLIVDVDGTYLRTDMLLESLWAGLGRAPFETLAALKDHWRSPQELKARMVELVDLRLDLLPVNEGMRAAIAQAQAEGREVRLASASDLQLVKALSEAAGLGSEVFASTPERNLKGQAKAAALVEAYGEDGFDYAGNAPVDADVWAKAHTAVVVGPNQRARAAAQKRGKPVVDIDGAWDIKDAIRAMRPHQWVKNVLLLLPIVAAHQFDLATLFWALLGILSFSFAASSIYGVNDLLDLEADRLHKTKCNRPYASGAVPIEIGMALSIGLGVLALAIGALLSPAFFGIVALYMVLSLAYSLRLKRMRWIDVATLATLYTLRVVAGAAATGVDASGFMLVFVFPIFLTLGCVKRLTELFHAPDDARLPGRGYGKPDRGDLLNMSAIGMVGALVIFFLYSFSPQAETLYPTQWLLWICLVPIAIWLYRMIKIGWLGAMDYDPIVFALRDKFGMGILLITLSLMFYAAGLWAEWFGLL